VIVVDTNVTSELMKPAPAPAVVAWVHTCDAADLYTTSITLAEIVYGIERLPGGRRKAQLKAVAEEVFSAFASQVLAFHAPAALEYATIVHGRNADRRIRCTDRIDLSRPRRNARHA
jgi:predicted nucleic acid-binding protein